MNVYRKIAKQSEPEKKYKLEFGPEDCLVCKQAKPCKRQQDNKSDKEKRLKINSMVMVMILGFIGGCLFSWLRF